VTEVGATGAGRARVPAVTVERFVWLAAAAAAALFLVTVSGATVRLTGSGLGCENWPRCGDTFLPEKDFHAYVEFGNRVVAFTVGLATLLAALGAWRAGLPRGLRAGAFALPALVLAQGVLGGITVIFELHPLIVMGHFLLSLLALALAILVLVGADRLARGEGAPALPGWLRSLALGLLPVALVLVVTGAFVTAAGPHSGGSDIDRLGNLEDALYVHVRVTAVFGVGFLVLVAALLRRRPVAPLETALALAVLAMLVAQMVVGEVQWRNQLPWWLVLVHVSLATLVWAGVVALAARVWLSSVRDPARSATRARALPQ
jgi:cytochrome c oxidase assembly protein subunit 15